MLKFATTLFTIFSIFLVSTTAPTLAQPQSKQGTEKAISQNTNTEKKTDLKKVFEKVNEQFKSESAQFDPVKTDRENAQQQATKKGWSKTKKALVITAVVVGIAALLFVAIKYAKKCLRYEDDCDPFYDEFCQCAEYERRIPKGQ